MFRNHKICHIKSISNENVIFKETISREEFKKYLSQFDTKELTISSYASSIMEAAKQALKNNSSIKHCLSNILTSTKTLEQIDALLKNHYEEIKMLLTK